MSITDSGAMRQEVLAERSGRCYVCGFQGRFELLCRSRREGFLCPGCRASLRYQHQAQTIVDLYGHRDTPSLSALAKDPQLAELTIYEPGVIGPYRKLWNQLPGYQNSYFWQDVPLGEVRDGVRCEDLQRLTFAPESFDLVVTSDIFEHVRKPWEAFASVLTVLKPGGRHVMSIPTRYPLPKTTKARVDTSTDADVHLEPPVYHGSPKDPRGSLVYTDFGEDLPDRLSDMGYEVSVHKGPEHTDTYVTRRPA